MPVWGDRCLCKAFLHPVRPPRPSVVVTIIDPLERTRSLTMATQLERGGASRTGCAAPVPPHSVHQDGLPVPETHGGGGGGTFAGVFGLTGEVCGAQQWLCRPQGVPGLQTLGVSRANCAGCGVSGSVSGSDAPHGMHPGVLTGTQAPEGEAPLFCSPWLPTPAPSQVPQARGLREWILWRSGEGEVQPQFPRLQKGAGRTPDVVWKLPGRATCWTERAAHAVGAGSKKPQVLRLAAQGPRFPQRPLPRPKKARSLLPPEPPVARVAPCPVTGRGQRGSQDLGSGPGRTPASREP